MSVYDVRYHEFVEITEIVFADAAAIASGIAHAHYVEPWKIGGSLAIRDSTYVEQGDKGYVVVTSKEHAENLIKALEKSIDLGWVK